ncbi:MAG: hypothetical protein Q9220_006456 [cf. Caloplaca sp. 1 TL-2023]
MTGITGSSIQPWLDLKLDGPFCRLDLSTATVPATIPLCQTRLNGSQEIILGNCTSVCNSTASFLDDELPNNLLTCGLWVSLVTLDTLNEDTSDPQREAVRNHYQEVLTRFTPLGLDAGNEAYAFAATGAVSTLMLALMRDTRLATYQADSIHASCSQQVLFPITGSLNYNNDVPQHVRDCVTAICAPRSLNPDLGGIGVRMKHSMLCIAIIILLGLLWLTVRPLRSLTKNEDHLTNLATVLLDFHKAQCYFITAIEIAVLVLASQAYNDLTDSAVFDVFLALPLSLNGIVPITFSLSCIALYSRLSRHIIILSIIPIAISSGALASTNIWILNMSDVFGPGMLGSYAGNAVVKWQGIVVNVCGSKSGNLKNALSRNDIRFTIIWLIYIYCIAWALWCVLKQTFKNATKDSRRARLLAKLKNSCLGRSESGSNLGKLAAYGYAASLVLWGLCFAYHFYLYSLFTRSNLVSGQWSLGQIIAVMVWIPSVVELLYIEHGKSQHDFLRLLNAQVNTKFPFTEGIEKGSRYRYPSGVQAVKIHPATLDSVDNIQLVPQSLREAESNEAEAG